MADLSLVVNGRAYGGWKSIRVTRSMESIAGSFDLEVADRWAGQTIPWPIVEEDRCIVTIDLDIVIAGYVDRRSPSFDATSRRLVYGGRDRSAALVDCSVVLDRWTFRNATVLEIARAVAEPFDIDVSLQEGIVLPKSPKIVVNPGDSPFQVIERAAQAAGVLAISDGAGGIILTRAGAARAEALVEGENILAASVDYDGTNRFREYIVVSQTAGTDEASGGITSVRATAIDEGVQRTDRVLLIRTEAGVSTDYARRRADWEARTRAAKAETVSVTVQGWRQTSGRLWTINEYATVRAPRLGVDGELLISQVDYSQGDGERTTLRLVRPDAFSPEPQAVVKKSGGLWKELAGGV